MQNNKEEFILKKKIEIIWRIFKLSKGFQNNFSFMLSIIYELIINQKQCEDTVKEEEITFFDILKEFKILPTFYIYIKANLRNRQNKNCCSISYNFFTSEILEEESFSNNNIQGFKRANSLTNAILANKFKTILNMTECFNCNINNEVIDNGEKIILTNMNDLKCKDCNEINSFILKTISEVGIENEDRLINPLLILIKILEKIIDNNGLKFNDVNTEIFKTLEYEIRILCFFLKLYNIDLLDLFENEQKQI
jgi:hypothetical protein